MDWRLFLTTFLAVFLAEMGDKTQLATMSLAASGSRWTVFGASAAALVTASALAVLGGELVARYVSPIWIRRAAGALFLVLGLVFLLRPADAAGDETNAGEANAGEANAGEANAGEANAGEASTDDASTDDASADHANADHATADPPHDPSAG